tara:strand:+ start:473 stop:802 length:330 start_codon:yes stop_codon:yes gene_type:complete
MTTINPNEYIDELIGYHEDFQELTLKYFGITLSLSFIIGLLFLYFCDKDTKNIIYERFGDNFFGRIYAILYISLVPSMVVITYLFSIYVIHLVYTVLQVMYIYKYELNK